MPQILDEVKQLLSQEKEKEAVEVLLALLKNGDEEIFQRAHDLFFSEKDAVKKATDDSSPKVGLGDFLQELEQDHKDLLAFLKEYNLAKIAFARQNWGKAKEAFTAALSLYKEGFSIPQRELKDHIKWCKNGMQMKIHLQAGAKAFKEGKWEEAKDAYRLALKLYQDGFPFPKEKITGSIQACENGKQYELIVGKARHWMTLENWFEARNSFLEARKLFRRGFMPDISTIDYEIELCNEALKDDEKNMSIGFWGDLRNNPMAILGTIGVLLICTIIGAYIMDFNRLSPTSYSRIRQDSLNVQAELVPEITNLEGENFELEDDNQEQNEVEEQSLPLSIGILPFCETDPILKVVADNLFKETNSQLQLSRSKLKYIDQSVILSHVRRARLNPQQVCQRQNVKRIAESIHISHLMVGDISQNEGGEIQVTYSVYLYETGNMQHAITVKGQNVQILKVKLKEALDRYVREVR